MSLTNVQDLSVQPAHRGLGLALKVQLSCNKLTRGPSGSLVGRGNAAHTIKVTTGIPAIPNVVFVRESFFVLLELQACQCLFMGDTAQEN